MKRSIDALIFICCFMVVYAQPNDGFKSRNSTKTVVFAGNHNFPPYEFLDESGRPVGFDIDLFTAIMVKIKMPYKIEMTDLNSVMGRVCEGKADVASLMYSNNRAKYYAFGPTIKYSFLYAVCSKYGKSVNSLADFAGKRVVVERRTLSDEIVKGDNIKCEIHRVSNLVDGLRGVSEGRYDIMLCPYDAAMYNIRKWNIKKLKLKDIGLPPSELCFAGTNEKLLNAINRGLYQIKHDGTYDKINDKWFTQKDNARVPKVVYMVIASLLLVVFIFYIFIHVLRVKVYHARKTLKENNEQLKLALSAGGIIVWRYDVCKARFFNVEHNIFPPEGRTLDEEVTYLHSEDQDRYREVITKAIGGVQPSKSLCFRMDYSKTGDWQYVEKEITLVRNKSGIVKHLIGTHKNITESVKHSEEMIRTQHKLECEMEKAKKADRLKSEFLANMSHEIRTPLNSIVGFSSLLKENIDSEERDVCINLIDRNSDMLIRLVNDILDFSKLEAGAYDFQRTTFNLSELMTVAYSSLASIGNSKEVELKLDVPYPICMVTSDYGRIQQVVTNFVTNAFKYTDRGYVKMGYQCMDDGIKFFVEDTGIGIAENKLDLVFNRFEKLGSFKQGTGLGLSICKVIVERFGGKIGVESVLGKGSTFWAWLPLAYAIE